MNLRAAGRIAALVLLFAVCAPVHIATKLLFGRSGWPSRFLAAAGWICGARVRRLGRPAQDRCLLVCNHVSWLDILVLGGATGCRFVSKDEIEQHPLLRWLADQNHTLYIRRSHRKGTADQANAVRAALREPQPLALFPEGTTGPGDALLPFRPALLSAVAPPPEGVRVRPVAIDYGEAAAEIAWHGESGKDNVLRLLGRRGTLPVIVHCLPPLAPGDDRKQLAGAAREAIGETLASSPAAADLYARAT